MTQQNIDNRKRILVTGANGFIGERLCHSLLEAGFIVRAGLRSANKISDFASKFASPNLECVVTGELEREPKWSELLNGVDSIVHLVAMVHQFNKNALADYRKINVTATEQLGAQAVRMGVQRLLYVSSIGVNGNGTSNKPFDEQSIPTPHSFYAISKLEAEQKLLEIGSKNLEMIILRPPLVYGGKAKGNFKSLLRLVQSGLPIPLASVKNKRSLIYVENLVDAIITCLTHQKAAGQTFLVSDNEAVSTAELIREIAAALGEPARLWPFPLSVMRMAGKMLGKSEMVDRLLGSLVVDNSKIKRELNWNPPYSLSQALQRDFSKGA